MVIHKIRWRHQLADEKEGHGEQLQFKFKLSYKGGVFTLTITKKLSTQEGEKELFTQEGKPAVLYEGHILFPDGRTEDITPHPQLITLRRAMQRRMSYYLLMEGAYEANGQQGELVKHWNELDF